MTVRFSCPAPERLTQLLEERLSRDERVELVAHVELCERCQHILEDLVGCDQSWTQALRHLAHAAPDLSPEAGIRRMVDELGASTPPPPGPLPPPPEEEQSLSFLGPSQHPDRLGRLAHYEVLSLVGRGGMGMVFKALDTSLQRVVALKVLSPRLTGDARSRKRFIREAQAAAAVTHENVVAIHAVEEAGLSPYLVMQFIGGMSLEECIRQKGPLEVKEVLRIGMQAAAGLAAAHAQGIIHRDIKPANILLENGVQRVKITDFGLACTVDDASLRPGDVVGTPLYMSPEQVRGKPFDHRADLFSLGSVLYTLCTGQPAFRAPDAASVLQRVCEDTPRPIRASNPDIPDWLAAIVVRLQQKDPALRFQSAAEVADLLTRHLAAVQQPWLLDRQGRPDAVALNM